MSSPELKIRELLPEYLDFWKRICSIETPSYDKTALNKQADFIEVFCTSHNFSVQRESYDRAGDTLVITLLGDDKAAPVALLAHMDTVHKAGAFGNPPVREEGGVLYGPGVFDCKGGIAVCLLAMDALSRSDKPHRTVRLILNSDEENGRYIGESGVDFIKRHARGAVAAFNAEAGREDSLTVGRKGIITAEIVIRGISGHAGNSYYDSASAVREAAYKILALEELSTGDVTFNCGKIEGGGPTNIVPDLCTVSVDIRFKNTEQQSFAREALDKVVGTVYVAGCSAKISSIYIRPAMECTAGNLELFDKVNQTAQELGMQPLLAKERGGGSDSAYTVELGIPTVCSMGTVGRYEHTVREESDVASLESRALLLAASILKI